MPPREARAVTARTAAKLLVAVGFLALAVAAWRARATPAAAYELSIYRATPLVTWVCAGLALGAALVALAVLRPGPTRGVAGVLGSATVLTLVSLPLIRGYAYLGSGDALSHLGWARAIAAGRFDAAALLYPADHVIAVQTALLTGVPLERAMLLVVPLFLLVALLFVPLTVRAVSPTRWAVPAGVVASWLVLPVDHVGVHAQVYPTTQALFFVPAVLFAAVVYLRRDATLDLPGGVSPHTVLVVGLGASVVVVHPQQALNVAGLFVVAGVVQAAVSRRRPGDAIAAHRSLALPGAVVGLLFFAWTARFDRARAAAEGVVTTVTGGDAAGAAAVGVRGGSLVELGGSLAELFVKLYLVEAIFLLGTAVAGVALLRGRLNGDARWLVAYLGAGMIPLGGLFVVYFVGSPTLAFRQLGFLVVLATVVGAVALALGTRRLGRRVGPGAARGAVTVALALAVVLATATLFPSPFIYKSSGHVTEEAFTGHAFVLDHRAEDVGVSRVALGPNPNRFADYHGSVDLDRGLDRFGADPVVPAAAFSEGRLPSAYDDPRYVTVTTADRQRTVGLYDEFRYTGAGYDALDETPGVNRVHADGYLELYLVGSTDRPVRRAGGVNATVTGA